MSTERRIKRLKQLIHQVEVKDADFTIEESERGELVIYTGIVMKGKRYKAAQPEQKMDYMSEEELEELEKEVSN